MSSIAIQSPTDQLHHVLRSQQFSRSMLERLFKQTLDVRNKMRNPARGAPLCGMLAGRIAVNLFYEPSTRTRLSFEMAQARLGMQFHSTENAKDFSSAAKGETIEDTIRVCQSYSPDVIVIRHFEDGAAERAAQISNVPIINAGDGKGQHPTQSLLDLFTIQDELGSIDGKTVIIGGDLKHGRTARSLAYLLSKFQDIRILFVSPYALRVGQDILEHLSQPEVLGRGVTFGEYDSLDGLLPQADVVYWTRVQKERMEDPAEYEREAGKFIITSEQMSEFPLRGILLHPLPRVNEIAREVDSDPRAAYFRQAENGMYVRMALLLELLNEY